MIPQWNNKVVEVHNSSETEQDTHHSYSWSSYFPQDKGGTFPDTNTGLKKKKTKTPVPDSF